MKTLQKELNELYEIQLIKNGSLFQKYLAQPVYKEVDKLKAAYSCESLKELHYLKGKRDGLKFFIGLLKGIDEEVKIKQIQLKSDAE